MLLLVNNEYCCPMRRQLYIYILFYPAKNIKIGHCIKKKSRFSAYPFSISFSVDRLLFKLFCFVKYALVIFDQLRYIEVKNVCTAVNSLSHVVGWYFAFKGALLGAVRAVLTDIPMTETNLPQCVQQTCVRGDLKRDMRPAELNMAHSLQ